MANVITVVGDSGSGKSTSLRTLDPKDTFIINTLNKALPFQGSAKAYNTENKNIGATTDWSTIVTTMQRIDKERPEIKHIIIDDAGYVMNKEMFDRAEEKGYDKFTFIAQHMYHILNTAKSLRDDLDIVFMFHMDEQVIDGLRIKRTIKLPGKMIEERFNPTHLSTVVVFTEVEFHKNEDEEYHFVVRKTPEFELAKSPMGMFEDKKIPNDMNLLLTKVREYYNAEND